MIIYEVNLEIQKVILSDYLDWLKLHISDMLKFDGFQSHQLFTIESEDKNFVLLSVHYHVESRKKLQDYFDHHAIAMRDEAIKKFGDRFKANRRILTYLT